MTPEQWVRENYYVVNNDIMGTVIVWGNEQGFIGVYTPIDKFVEMFGEAMQTAINAGKDVKQAIREADPENMRGFNDLL